MTQTTWATAQDVITFTPVTAISDQLVMVAGATIDVHSSRIYALDNDKVGARDAYYLKLAVCYQAAWLTQQPDGFIRMDITALGQSRSITQFGPNAMTLAPFAKATLKRVSWLKGRSLHVQSAFTDGIGVLGADPLSSASDDLYPWEPIEGA